MTGERVSDEAARRIERAKEAVAGAEMNCAPAPIADVVIVGLDADLLDARAALREQVEELGKLRELKDAVQGVAVDSGVQITDNPAEDVRLAIEFRDTAIAEQAEEIELLLHEAGVRDAYVVGQEKEIGGLKGDASDLDEQLRQCIDALNADRASLDSARAAIREQGERIAGLERVIAGLKESCGEWSDIASGQSEQITLDKAKLSEQAQEIERLTTLLEGALLPCEHCDSGGATEDEVIDFLNDEIDSLKAKLAEQAQEIEKLRGEIIKEALAAKLEIERLARELHDETADYEMESIVCEAAEARVKVLKDALRDLMAWGIEHNDIRVGYIVVQVSRASIDIAARALAGEK